MPIKPEGLRRLDGRGGWSALGAGFELAMSVLIGCFAGLWADERLGMSPWLFLAGAIAGISIGLYQFIRRTVSTRR